MTASRWNCLFLLSSKKTPKQIGVKVWFKRCYNSNGLSASNTESQGQINTNVLIPRDPKKNNPSFARNTLFGCRKYLSKSFLKNFSEIYRISESKKQLEQQMMEAIKALFETPDQEDNRGESSESESMCCGEEQSGSSIIDSSCVLGEEDTNQTITGKLEQQSELLNLQEDEELIIPFNFFLESSSERTQIHDLKPATASNQRETSKTRKERKKERKKLKRRKPSHSFSENEEVTDNKTNKSDNNKDIKSADGSASLKKNLVCNCKKGRVKKKRKKQISEDESEDDSDQVVSPRKPNPNYFVAVRVSNPGIHSSVKKIQDSMVNFDEYLKAALIPVSTLHITLMVMHLQEEEVEKATEVLKSCKSDFATLSDGIISMTFEGLAHFRNEVIYGKMNDENEVDKLKLLATTIRNNYEKNGISTTDDRPFTPHLTIMKLSRMPKRKKKKKRRKIPSESYSSWIECELGKEKVSEVLLCSMNHKKDEEGFYHCIGSVGLSNDLEIIQETTGPSQEL